MNVELGRGLTFRLVTNNYQGESQDADSTPTCAVYEDANDTSIYSPAVVNRATGEYRVTVDCTPANGFSEGKSYNVVVTAVVGGVTSRAILGTFLCYPARPRGSVVTDAGNTATAFKTDRAEAVNDYWKNAIVLVTSGALDGQIAKVQAYNGTTKTITLSAALTGVPADGVTFILINV